MKMIRDSRFPLRNRVPGSTIVRIVFGAIFAVVFFLLLASAITASNDDDMTVSLVFGFQFLIGAALMILFVRWCSPKKRHDLCAAYAACMGSDQSVFHSDLPHLPSAV